MSTPAVDSSLSQPDPPSPEAPPEHLIVVSNRLPVTITKDAQGEYHFKMSSGGLVSALSGTKKSMSFTWIGWPGFYIPPKERHIVDKRLKEEYSCQAVYLDDDVADRHYNGFSNSILWPLFHYHPGEMNFDEENWLAYRIANMRFAEAVRQQVRENSMVWVQDYHLMLLPMLLRGLVTGPELTREFTSKELANITQGVESEDFPLEGRETVRGVKIGFFLHTPFPSSEIYRFVGFPSCVATCPYAFLFSGSCPFAAKFSLAYYTRTCSGSTPTIMPVTSCRRVLVSYRFPRCPMVSSLKGGSRMSELSRSELTQPLSQGCVSCLPLFSAVVD
jgi:hypothetical protein